MHDGLFSLLSVQLYLWSYVFEPPLQWLIVKGDDITDPRCSATRLMTTFICADWCGFRITSVRSCMPSWLVCVFVDLFVPLFLVIYSFCQSTGVRDSYFLVYSPVDLSYPKKRQWLGNYIAQFISWDTFLKMVSISSYLMCVLIDHRIHEQEGLVRRIRYSLILQ